MRFRPIRSILLRAGILPAIVAIVVLLKVIVMMGHDSSGREDFTDGDLHAAADHFDSNRSWNWFEPWIAPFDHGTAVHADGSHDDAVEFYDEALASVPAIEECTVRINQALAHESLGDAALEGPPPDREQAKEQWQAGIDTLAEGECPTDSGRGEEQTEQAAEVDRRLREKLQEQEEQPEQEQPEEPSPQEQELDDRNQQGQDDRQDQQEGDGNPNDPDGGDEPDGESGGGFGEPGEGTGDPAPAW